jgi:hypothetical protein
MTGLKEPQVIVGCLQLLLKELRVKRGDRCLKSCLSSGPICCGSAAANSFAGQELASWATNANLEDPLQPQKLVQSPCCFLSVYGGIHMTNCAGKSRMKGDSRWFRRKCENAERRMKELCEKSLIVKVHEVLESVNLASVVDCDTPPHSKCINGEDEGSLRDFARMAPSTSVLRLYSHSRTIHSHHKTCEWLTSSPQKSGGRSDRFGTQLYVVHETNSSVPSASSLRPGDANLANRIIRPCHANDFEFFFA